jgi:hypothetical protein
VQQGHSERIEGDQTHSTLAWLTGTPAVTMVRTRIIELRVTISTGRINDPFCNHEHLYRNAACGLCRYVTRPLRGHRCATKKYCVCSLAWRVRYACARMHVYTQALN